MPTPNWLTAWVKINTKHGMHPGALEKQSDLERHHKASSSNASTQLTDDSSSVPKRQVASKRNRSRGLQRTFSASDLIREAASGSSATLPRRESIDSKKGLDHAALPHRRVNDRDADTLSTARSSVDPLLHQDSSHGSQFMDEILFIQQLEQKQVQQGRVDSCSVAETKLQSQSMVRPNPLKQVYSLSPPPAPPRTGLAGLLPHPFFANQPVCQQCNSLTNQLEALHEDVDYMRKLALKRETEERSADVTVKKEASRNKQQVMPSLASMQLADMAARQRKQVQQLMQERFRWQQDMHFKLNKFANLCKDLNEESGVRSSEAMSLRQEICSVKNERDSMAEELTCLRAQERLFKKQEDELQLMRERLAFYESRALAEVSQAVQSRDATIADLTDKLDRVLVELESSRSQAAQRRVIFPDTRR